MQYTPLALFFSFLFLFVYNRSCSFLCLVLLPLILSLSQPFLFSVGGYHVTVAHPAVIPTRPANTELKMSQKLNFPVRMRETIREVQHAQDAEMVIVTAMRRQIFHLPPERPFVALQLNPYQPNHRMKTPTQAMLKECPSNFPAFLGSKRPCRGPHMTDAKRDTMPPSMCTTQDPGGVCVV